MDPDVTLATIAQALAVDEHDEAREAATNLVQWIDDGGFPPNGWPGAQALVRAIARPTPARRALIVLTDGDTPDTITSYLPGNYAVVGLVESPLLSATWVLVEGRDVAGWTLDDYVLPRLASGLRVGFEAKPWTA